MPEIEYAPATLALACPYCGSAVEPILEYTGFAHSEHRDWTGTECEGCMAAWERDGTPRNGPHAATLAMMKERVESNGR